MNGLCTSASSNSNKSERLIPNGDGLQPTVIATASNQIVMASTVGIYIYMSCSVVKVFESCEELAE